MDIPVCYICQQPIRLEIAKIDENGKPVHEHCYTQRVLASLHNPPTPHHAE
jgi:hypothetical protein